MHEARSGIKLMGGDVEQDHKALPSCNTLNRTTLPARNMLHQWGHTSASAEGQFSDASVPAELALVDTGTSSLMPSTLAANATPFTKASGNHQPILAAMCTRQTTSWSTRILSLLSL